ncbi:MAG TPA: Asp-tRNA(Asn)/Glu-tRNA(Gln) amidotransferase subunit GatB [Candidatus Saccharimonadales bacterium]|nr:Asp-tRNA(Asn)/Glu-tRNA(Gln) amidotransferase subunit GatB [Candidatus Saccharimonadales bacterium]
MITDDIRTQYTATIGIECHVQLKTATKLFIGIGNDAREADPNTLVGPLCFGLPGTLPVLNQEAVRLAMKAAFALGTTPQKFSAFDRKHYFYPDLPLGYQITQFEHPIIRDGFVNIEVDGQIKRVGIHEAHIEADAGKSTHPAGADYSLVDLNRAGTPLLEIVSEPDMHTAEEARIYAKELYLRMKYAEVSDANLYYGNMRFDVNVSVSRTSQLGTRTETKNLNSFRAVEKTIEYEIKRQIELLEKGQAIVQETRGWDDAKQRTFTQRSKENAHDYRYFPDPDLPPITLTDELIASVKAGMPIMPDEWRARLQKLGMDEAQIATLLEGDIEDPSVRYLPLIEEAGDQPEFSKALANWFVNLELPLRHDESVKINAITNQARLSVYRSVFELVKANKLNSSNAKELLIQYFTLPMAAINGRFSVEEFAKQHNLIQESDEGAIAKIVADVLAANPKAAEDVKNGEMKAIGFLVGQVMKQSQGRANPQLAQALIKQQLEI